MPSFHRFPVFLRSGITGGFEGIPPCMEAAELFENYYYLMSALIVLAITFLQLCRSQKWLGRGPYSSLQRLSPSSSFKIDGKICQRYLTRIDRTIQKFSARRTGLVVNYDEAWVTSKVLALSVQRAQITLSTQGIVTHSQARGSEAGAQRTFS